jgi:glutaryl-CoA transferase
MGASVIKVERPDARDDTRGWCPPADFEGESAYFLSVNRNKLGITADLDDPTELALLRSLTREADVVIDISSTLTPSPISSSTPRIVR